MAPNVNNNFSRISIKIVRLLPDFTFEMQQIQSRLGSQRSQTLSCRGGKGKEIVRKRREGSGREGKGVEKQMESGGVGRKEETGRRGNCVCALISFALKSRVQTNCTL